ncbi:hypothetical protein V6N13_143819 [Hibiscus sabdariffa]
MWFMLLNPTLSLTSRRIGGPLISSHTIQIPESLHMFTFLFDDLGVPQDYRHMEGSGVKFHRKPTCGGKCLLEEEAIMIGESNHSHATQYLHVSIAAGKYPEWKRFIRQ